jgi:GTP-binding protein HflX
VVGQFTQKRASFDAAAWVGVGKRAEIREFLRGQSSAGNNLPQAEAESAAEQVEFILADHEVFPRFPSSK